ncbi:sensor histidine kinase [Rhodococcus pyridinivorans]|uniref:sensor histidine kinase n=1 Tax=Rhodococcus pyridinivorans TaxID=103816 RepID=UPI002283C0C1|nr:ATP-binding protein [Rhodococcus pyridinivorans]WAL49335.1 ATP-binding protein [Rhodococcus pyridinivorans]
MKYATGVGATVALSEFGLSLDRNHAIFNDYTTPVEALATRKDLAPAVSEAIAQTLADGQELTRAASTPGTALPIRIEQMRAFGEQVQHTVRTLVEQTENATAFGESERLLDLWQTRLAPFEQAAAFTQSVEDSEVARKLLEATFATERALLSALRAPEEDQQALTELRLATEKRHDLLLSPISSAARGTELTTSLVTSVEIGDRLIDASVDRIVATLDEQRDAARSAAIRTGMLIAIAIACTVVVTLALTKLIVSSLRQLRDATTRVAYHDLPAAIAAIRAETDPALVTTTPIGVNTDEEIGQVARAVDGVHSQALLLAAEQAALRRQITAMLETLARRNRSLVDRQLMLIETLEFKERNPDRLQNLFELDHLATRMRRTGESLLVLAGTRARRSSRSATLLEDVMRASISQVENYQRVRLGTVPPITVVGHAVDDLIHLLTELLDNALRASDPSTSVVFVAAPAIKHGMLLEIVDRGIGLPPPELARINHRLIEAVELDAQATRHMGLYVVGQVAQRHGLQVRLRPTTEAGAARGITASAYLPPEVITGHDVAIAPRSITRTSTL